MQRSWRLGGFEPPEDYQQAPIYLSQVKINFSAKLYYAVLGWGWILDGYGMLTYNSWWEQLAILALVFFSCAQASLQIGIGCNK
jgi:hypothetical protein